MKGARRTDKRPPGARLPEFKRIPLDRILEPALPARAQANNALMHELIESFQELGQIEPITVECRGANYEIVAGHRRYLAARELHWKEMAALVYAEGGADKLAIMLHENTVREDLNPAEEALFMAQAREQLDLDEAGLCRVFHKTVGYIADRFALLRGDAEVFNALQRGEIRVGVAHQLNRISDAEMRHYYLDCARRSDPPARVVSQWVASWQSQKAWAARGVVDAAAGVIADAELPVTVSGDAPAAPGDGASGAPPGQPRIECALCGGAKDPYNLVSVMMHKWHWDEICAAVERAQKGQQ